MGMNFIPDTVHYNGSVVGIRKSNRNDYFHLCLSILDLFIVFFQQKLVYTAPQESLPGSDCQNLLLAGHFGFLYFHKIQSESNKVRVFPCFLLFI